MIAYILVDLLFYSTMRLTATIIFLVFLLACGNSQQGINKAAKNGTDDTSKIAMTDTLKKDILEQIDVSVKSGFNNKDQVFSQIEEYLDGISFDPDWTKQKIDSAYSERLREQTTWPAVTSFDKLVQAFDDLCSSGIIALHNAGVTKQDGEEDCAEIHEDLLKKGTKTIGFCYYHWQDVERVVNDGHLYIGFGDFNNSDKNALEIGKQVAAKLEKQGFRLNWDRSVATRIEITNISWQKKLNDDRDSYDRTVELLSKAREEEKTDPPQPPKLPPPGVEMTPVKKNK